MRLEPDGRIGSAEHHKRTRFGLECRETLPVFLTASSRILWLA
jgi:hypothetical protein